jgi:predicted helicase
VGQSSGNDNNANLKYPTLDESIRSTYAERSTATNKNSLYDSYIRAIRWGSNRILNSPTAACSAYVSNGSYIDGNTADGLRKTLDSEFHDIYVYNLRGNQRTAGEQSRMRRREDLRLRQPKYGCHPAAGQAARQCVGELSCITATSVTTWIGKEKLTIVDNGSLADVRMGRPSSPVSDGDWINHRNTDFESHSRGVTTARDAWVYNSSEAALQNNATRMVDAYNAQLDADVQGQPVSTDPTVISWSGGLQQLLTRREAIDFDPGSIRTAAYRPFQKQKLAFQSQLNERRALLPGMFPTPGTENLGFYISGAGSTKPFSCLMTDLIPDVNLYGSEGGQFFPRYTYSSPVVGTLFESAQTGLQRDRQHHRCRPGRISNRLRSRTSPRTTSSTTSTALLHSSRSTGLTFASDLKKMLPRIPQVPGADRFRAFVEAGKALSDLHIGYESLEPYALNEVASGLSVEQDDYARYAVTKMKYAGKAGAWDKTRIIYNSQITLEGIPEEAQRYMLGSRSAVDWILERYQVKTDKASGIVNDPNDWAREHDQPRYIIDLIGRIVTLSLETNKIVETHEACPESSTVRRVLGCGG